MCIAYLLLYTVTHYVVKFYFYTYLDLEKNLRFSFQFGSEIFFCHFLKPTEIYQLYFLIDPDSQRMKKV